MNDTLSIRVTKGGSSYNSDADSDLEEDLKSSSEDEDGDFSAFDDEIDAPAGEIRGKTEEEKEEEERAGLVSIKTTCLPRSVEITNRGLQVLKSQYIVALKSTYTRALTFENF